VYRRRLPESWNSKSWEVHLTRLIDDYLLFRLKRVISLPDLSVVVRLKSRRQKLKSATWKDYARSGAQSGLVARIGFHADRAWWPMMTRVTLHRIQCADRFKEYTAWTPGSLCFDCIEKYTLDSRLHRRQDRSWNSPASLSLCRACDAVASHINGGIRGIVSTDGLVVVFSSGRLRGWTFQCMTIPRHGLKMLAETFIWWSDPSISKRSSGRWTWWDIHWQWIVEERGSAQRYSRWWNRKRYESYTFVPALMQQVGVSASNPQLLAGKR